MGLTLTLMPLKDARQLAGRVLCYNRLQFVSDYKIFAQIADKNGKSEVPDEGVEAPCERYELDPWHPLENHRSHVSEGQMQPLLQKSRERLPRADGEVFGQNRRCPPKELLVPKAA